MYIQDGVLECLSNRLKNITIPKDRLRSKHASAHQKCLFAPLCVLEVALPAGLPLLVSNEVSQMPLRTKVISGGDFH